MTDPGAVPVEVPEEAVDAAARECASEHHVLPWDTLSTVVQQHYRDRASAMLSRAYPLIAARVQAEGKAERDAELRRWIEVGQRLAEEKRLAEAERDEHHRNWRAVEQELTRMIVHDTRVRAGERQRIADEIQAAADSYPYSAEKLVAYRHAARLAAAGSAVPVATPEPLELVGIGEAAAILGVSKQRVHQLCTTEAFPEPVARLAATPVWLRSAMVEYAAVRRDRRLRDPGPVATPTEPDDGPTHEQIDHYRVEDGLSPIYAAEQDGQR